MIEDNDGIESYNDNDASDRIWFEFHAHSNANLASN